MSGELGDGALVEKLRRRGEAGAFAWELDPDRARSVGQRLRHMADSPYSPVERCVDPLYRNATKFRFASTQQPGEGECR